jgi:hypothetical protein
MGNQQTVLTKNAPLVFGWVVAGHQLGAACAAFFAGFVRSAQGDYLQAIIHHFIYAALKLYAGASQ